MSAQLNGAEYVVTGTATNLTSIIGGERIFVSVFAMRANDGNTGTVYLGKANLTAAANRLGFLKAGDALGVDLAKSFFSSSDLYIIGSVPGDILHILELS